MAQITMVEAVKMMNELVDELDTKYKNEIAERDKKIVELEQKLTEANTIIAAGKQQLGTTHFDYDSIPFVGSGCTVKTVALNGDGSSVRVDEGSSELYQKAEFHREPCSIPIEGRIGKVFASEDR